MGRNTSGYISTGQALRIELSLLIKQGYIRKGFKTSSTIDWTNGASIGIRTEYTSTNKYIQLDYCIETAEGIKQTYSRIIELFAVPSNLGKGEILYFICPESGRMCRILYKCYGSHVWKSRKAYRNRIYYLKQMLSKRSYYLESYLNTEKQLTNLLSQRRSYYYMGRPTKRLQRIKKLQKDLARLDYLTLVNAPAFIQQMMY